MPFKEKRAVKPEYKKEVGVFIFILLTFGGYFTGVKASSFIQKDEIIEQVNEESKNTDVNLQNKFITSSHIYISDSNVEKVKIFEDFKEYLQDFFNTSIMKIRQPSSFKSCYEGLSSSGVKMSTDLDTIKFEYLNQTSYYKIAEPVKKNFKDLLTKIIYFSPSSLKNTSNWEHVTVSLANSNIESIKIKKRDFDELASKVSIVRKCGKIQPERNNKQAKKQYIVEIETKSGKYKISTMNKNYIKIEFNNDFLEYFEVQPYFFEYLSNIL